MKKRFFIVVLIILLGTVLISFSGCSNEYLAENVLNINEAIVENEISENTFKSKIVNEEKFFDIDDEEYKNAKKIALNLEDILLSESYEINTISLKYINKLSHQIIFNLKDNTSITLIFNGEDELYHFVCKSEDNEILLKTAEEILEMDAFDFSIEDIEKILNYKEDNTNFYVGDWVVAYHDANYTPGAGRVLSILSKDY